MSEHNELLRRAKHEQQKDWIARIGAVVFAVFIGVIFYLGV